MNTYLIAAVSAGVLAVSGCGPQLVVHSTPAPDPTLTGRLTFRVIAAPGYLGGISAGANHSPLMNEGTSAALRRDIVNGLNRRGYVEARDGAGVLVVYYLAMPPSTDFTDWDNGYLWRPGWARGQVPGSANLSPAEFADGAVVIDMIDPATGELLWQGHGATSLPDDQRRLTRDLGWTVSSILGAVPGPAVALN